MPRSWTTEERENYFSILHALYVKENKTISEIGRILNVSEKTIFSRLKKLCIPTRPDLKAGYLLKKRTDILIPKSYNSNIAEFFGIMLGDGKLSKYQVIVNLGTKEMDYANEVVNLIARIFGVRPKVAIRKTGYKDVYLGSVALTEWLKKEGLVYNKVLSQVDAPKWINRKKNYIENFLRGFFDTDGSVYKLRWGIQMSFTNKSLPLLKSVQSMLLRIGYNPSKISKYRVYLTRKKDTCRFFREVNPRNIKHQERYKKFISG